MMSDHENCEIDPIEKPVDMASLELAQATFLGVAGMGCPNCAIRVRNGLLSLEGVLQADVHLENGMVAVAYQPDQLTPDDLVTAVFQAGNDGRHHYQARILKSLPAKEAFTTL